MFKNAIAGFNRPVFEQPDTPAGAPPAAAAPPAAPPASPAAPWDGAEGVWKIGEGDTAQPWYSVIPEEAARQHVEAKGYATPAELALANLNLTKLQRNDPTVVGVPGKDATPEDFDKFYTALGRPEAPEGYEFKFEEGFNADQGMVDFAKGAFHEAGLTPAQAQKVADAWNKFAGETGESAAAARAQANEAALAALEQEYGADLEKNTQAGRRVATALGLKAEHIQAIEGQIGSAVIVDLLAKIGRKSDEGGFLSGSENGDPNDVSSMTKEQASAKIAELQGDTEFQKKYTDRNHPEHKSAVAEMEKLFTRV